MNDDPSVGIVIEEIDRVPTLPYWPSYADWIAHLGTCAHCMAVMDPATGTGLVSDLCPDGYAHQTATHWDIAIMRATAALN